jgi:EAL domain-containing protein (putative c-di-GMP-specific phosphodiesterase class I)
MTLQMKTQTIAEGVETREQLAVQTEYGCRGFLYGKPMSADEFIILIRDADKPESLLGS